MGHVRCSREHGPLAPNVCRRQKGVLRTRRGFPGPSPLRTLVPQVTQMESPQGSEATGRGAAGAMRVSCCAPAVLPGVGRAREVWVWSSQLSQTSREAAKLIF